MTQQSDHVTLSEDPGDLIAAIPALLHFVPADSVVLIGLATGVTPRQVCFGARTDLPMPEEMRTVIQQLSTYVDNNSPDVVELIVVTRGAEDSAGLPRRDLVDELTRMLHDQGVTLGHCLWVERIERGLTWRSYADPTASGPVADPAGLGFTDSVIYASSEEFAAQLAPDPETVLKARSRLLQALPSVHPEHDLAFLRATVDRIGTDQAPPLELDDETIVRLGHALTHPDVREAGLEFALTERADAAQRLWTLLTRALPRSIVANPACLLAACAYLNGGPLASAAIEVALAADPDHTLTNIFRRLLYSGVPPERFRKGLADAFYGVRQSAEPVAGSSAVAHCVADVCT